MGVYERKGEQGWGKAWGYGCEGADHQAACVTHIPASCNPGPGPHTHQSNHTGSNDTDMSLTVLDVSNSPRR